MRRLRSFPPVLTGALLLSLPSVPSLEAANCSVPSFTIGTNPANVQLTPWAIAVGDWNKDGDLDLAVTNSNSSSVSIRLGNGTGTFAAGSDVIGLGNQPEGITSGDFDGDGFIDLAVAVRGANKVQFLRGMPGGSFTLDAFELTGPNARAVVAADFDRNGLTDLAVAGYANDRVFFYLRTGPFAFAAPTNLLTGKNPMSLAVGDYDRDGDLDVASASEVDFNVSFLRNDGTGFFTEPFGVAGRNPVGSFPRAIASADFDRDGRLDLVTADFGSDTLSLLRGVGDGTFTSPPPVPVLRSPSDVAAADFDRDGQLDLVASSLADNAVVVNIGAGGFNFPPGTSFAPVDPGPRGVAVGDFNNDGKPDVAAALSGGNEVDILTNESGLPCPASSFAPAARAFATPLNPSRLLKGDFDRDGRLDVAVNNFSTDSVAILFANGPGVFGAPVNLPTLGTSNGRMAAADFDGNGELDIVTANSGSNDVSVLRGTGGGAFLPASTFPAGTSPYAVAAADLTGDGKPDIVVANNVSGDVSVLVNNGPGFDPPLNFPAGPNPLGIAIGDVNGDGRLDVVVSLAAPTDQVALLVGSGPPGSLSPPTSFGLSGSQPEDLVLHDFDGDLDLDLATANRSTDNVSILLWNAGAFVVAGTHPVSNSPFDIVADDFNGDGRLDLATSGTSVLIGLGGGGFMPAINLGAGGIGLASGDFTGDNQPDLTTIAQVASSVLLYVGNGNGGFGFAPIFTLPAGVLANSAEVGDFDRDGNLDVVVAAGTPGAVRVRLGDGAGAFPTAAQTLIGSNNFHAAPGDFDRDGILDVAVVDGPASVVRIMKGTGTGTFALLSSATAVSGPRHVAAGDFDRDGDLDVAVACSNGMVRVYRNNGGGGIGGAPFFSYNVGVGLNLRAVVAGYLDGDLILDLAVASSNGDSVTILRGIGNATFGFLTTRGLPGGTTPVHLALGDFNGDGSLDFVTANNGGTNVTFARNSGTGTFPSIINSPVGDGATWIVASDFNQDGLLDVAVSRGTPALVTVLLGNGSGSFLSPVSFGAGSEASSVALGDFNRDGKLDLLSASLNAQSLSVFTNTNCTSRRFELLNHPSACNTANLPFASQPRLRLFDDGANQMECDGTFVTASIIPGTGTPGAILGGTLSLPLSFGPGGGNVDYTNLSIDRDGVGYKLRFSHTDAAVIPARTRRFTVGLTVDINGPATVCSGSPTAWNAVAPPFVIPPFYDKYSWVLDATPVPGGANLVLGPLAPNNYILRLDATLDACPVTKMRPFITEPPLSPPTLSVGPGSTTVCTSCTGATIAVTETDGGPILGRSWGFRAISGGPVTPFSPAETGPNYTIDGNDFPSTGTFFVVETSSPTCGAATVSNEVPVTVFTTVAGPKLPVFTATSKNMENGLEWLNPTGAYQRTLVNYNASTPATSDCVPPSDVDPGAGTTLTLQGSPALAGERDAKLHGGLFNDTTYCYTAFVEVAPGTFAVPGRRLVARPFDHTAGDVKWAFSTGVATLSPPGNGQGVVHLVDNDGVLHTVVKGDTGGHWAPTPWKPPVMPLPSQTGRPGGIPVTVAGESPVVFLSSQDGHVYAFSATRGTQVWSPAPSLGPSVAAAPSGVFTAFGGSRSLIFAGSRIGAGANTFFGLDVFNNGNFSALPGWSYSGDGTWGQIGEINGQAMVDQAAKRVYFASQAFGGTNTLWCLHLETGAPQWAVPAGNISVGVTLRGTTLYVGIDGGGVMAYNTNGTPKWLAPYPTPSTIKGFVFADRLNDNLYFAAGNTLYKVADDGVGPNGWTEKWTIPLPFASTPIVIAGDPQQLVYVGSDGRLFRRNQSDGSAFDDWPLGDQAPIVRAIVGSPTLDLRQGYVYVGTEAGVLYAIKP